MELHGCRAIVVGLGRSGVAAARLLMARGARVIGTDLADVSRLPATVSDLGIELLVGGHDSVKFGEADLVVVSPGIPPLPQLEEAARSGIPVIGELELASRLVTAPIVAVGGTNGKSTVTTLLARMCEEANLRTFAGGNLGTPLSDAVGGAWDVLVVEVSSFQLERIATFRPRVSILLNVTDDHLDRYPSFLAYANAKGNAFSNQQSSDVAIVPEGDSRCAEQARRGGGRLIRFGAQGEYRIAGRTIEEPATGERFTLEGSELHGMHNVGNAAAAIAAARCMGVEPRHIAAAIASFVPLKHRMAYVGDIRGVRFYDDSKGTNVGASVTALRGLAEPKGVLIAGGRDKLGSYGPLVDALRDKGRGLVVLGEAAQAIADAVGSVVPTVRASTMSEAVALAFQMARKDDAVLLSPACSSFDMFSGYAERGDRFVESVADLGRALGAAC